MCGIIGYTGGSQVLPKLFCGLESLEYRGYDSAGIAFYDTKAGMLCLKEKGTRFGNQDACRRDMNETWAGKSTRIAESGIRAGRRMESRPI